MPDARFTFESQETARVSKSVCRDLPDYMVKNLVRTRLQGDCKASQASPLAVPRIMSTPAGVSPARYTVFAIVPIASFLLVEHWEVDAVLLFLVGSVDRGSGACLHTYTSTLCLLPWLIGQTLKGQTGM